MNKTSIPPLLLGLSFLLAVCARGAERDGPVRTEIVKTGDVYQLLRDGEPYFVRGAGLEFGDMASLAAHGGNSFRNWTTDNGRETAGAILDRAHRLGLTVALCLPMQAERWGFDYGDEQAVARQLAEMREAVLAYRDHPALLVWIIGNELNFDYGDPRVYDAVNDVSKMIHELDPWHPTTTTVAGLGENVVRDIEQRAPDLDFISFQTYGELFALPEFIEEIGYEKPFFVTEWGAIGHWETGKTRWGAPIEATSSEKADVYLRGYRQIIEPNLGQIVGNYAFLWGQKQERTPTWFGMFTESGEETEVVDVMHYIWNGEWPENRSPALRSLTLDARHAQDSVVLTAGREYGARVRARDEDGDPLAYAWAVKPESDTTEVGGDFEESIEDLEGLVEPGKNGRARVTAPARPGPYRLFVYVRDGQGHAAHANLPFSVRGD